MVRPNGNAAVSVERFFQFSLLGLVASGYLAVAGSGYLDLPTIVLTAAGLLLRGLLIYEVIRLEISNRAATFATVAYSGFYALDYVLLARDFLGATVHLVFFLAVLKILTAKTNRDHLYTAAIAFVELIAAAILSVNFNFFLFLTLYLLFAIAALTSGEIRRSMHQATATARSGLRRFHPRLAVLSLFVTLGILTLTAGLFFLLPRTADAAFSRLMTHRMHLPGFSNQVTLGEIGEIKITSRPVMHIRVYGNAPFGLKWRGGALVDFDGKRWFNPGRNRQRIPVSNGEAELLPPSERPSGRRLNYDVDFDEIGTDALFFAGTAATVRMHLVDLYRVEGGAYRLGQQPSPGFHYEAYSLLEEPPESAPPQFPAPILPLADRERYLQLPPLDPRIPELAKSMASGMVAELMRARAIEKRLRTDYGYTLELPSREVSDPLAHFLFTRKKGHCEYFASAMTVMLRSLGIPARLATGFQTGVYNRFTDLWVVRASDAHTWVEAWIPGHGWTTFDPTPPDPGGSAFGFMAKFGLYLDAAETFWHQWVVGYDAGQQGSLADGLEQSARRVGISWYDAVSLVRSGWNGRVGTSVRRYWIVPVLGLCLWLLCPRLWRLMRVQRRVVLVRRGHASAGDATLLYDRMLRILKRHGYHKPAWFTPVEFAASLPPGPLGAAVAEFTDTYNALRFGARVEEAARLSALLDEMQKQGRHAYAR